MKKLSFLLLVTVFSIILFAGCSSNDIIKQRVSTTSMMIRTVGVNESAIPIEAKSYAIEFFNNQATTVDLINKTHIIYSGDNAPENELYLSGDRISHSCRYYGVNARFAISNYTELKVGGFLGHNNKGSKQFKYINPEGDDVVINANYDTSIRGFQLGIKHLLTDYNNPHLISLYAEGKYLTTSSPIFYDDAYSKFDGVNMELKSALMYGYLPNRAKRDFPSVALYYSFANTKRDETIIDISRKKQPQAIGLEASYNFDPGRLYYLIYLGVEKETIDKATNGLIIYFGGKIAFYINPLK